MTFYVATMKLRRISYSMKTLKKDMVGKYLIVPYERQGESLERKPCLLTAFKASFLKE